MLLPAPRLRFAVALTCLVALTGCSDDTSPDSGAADVGQSDTGADATADAGDDAGVDSGADVGGDADDAGGFTCPDFPSPQVAGTTETDALADDPAQCGQPDYSWVRNAPLGQVVEMGSEREFSAAVIQGVLDAEGFQAPRPIAHDVVVRQFSYTTQDRGQVVTASALVAVPTNWEPDRPIEPVLFLHGTTGFNDACSPSDTFEWKALSAAVASMGYLVVAPDYIGLDGVSSESTGFLHPYLVGQPTAIASLDAMRALAHLDPAVLGGLCPSSRFVAVGGSQGGHAAMWVDRLAPYYARELELLGVVATVPPTDLVGQLARGISQVVDATANSVAFLGTAAGWYGYGGRLDEVFATQALADDVTAALADQSCSFDGFSMPDQPTDLWAQALVDPADAGELAGVEPWGCLTAENGLTTTSVPRMTAEPDSYGILIVHGENDDLVHVPTERAAFEALCADGLPMAYLECAGASHGGTTAEALGPVLDFVDARVAGQAFDAACQVTAPVDCQAQ